MSTSLPYILLLVRALLLYFTVYSLVMVVFKIRAGMKHTSYLPVLVALLYIAFAVPL